MSQSAYGFKRRMPMSTMPAKRGLLVTTTPGPRRRLANRGSVRARPLSMWPAPRRNPPFNSTFVRLKLASTISTNGAGTITPVTFSPSVIATTPDWASYVALFDSFIVHAFTLQLIVRPNAIGNDQVGGHVVTWIDLDGVTPATDVVTAMAYTSAERMPGNLNSDQRYSRTVLIPPDRRVTPNSTTGGFALPNQPVSINVCGDNFLVPTVVQYLAFTTYFVEFQDSR